MTLAAASTALFVPGHRADRFHKAAACGADVVIIDLEDAVGAAHKDAARHAAYVALTDNSGLRTAVRINTLEEGGATDIEMLVAIGTGGAQRLAGVIVPKAENPEALASVSTRLGENVPIVALIETAQGLASAEALGRGPRVVRLAFGAIDFGVDINATSDVILDYARCELVLASRRAGLAAPLDSPNPEFRDLDAVRVRAVASRALGFGGQLCIHPAQVRLVAKSFLPTADEISWAEKITEGGSGSATQVDGRMVDRPVYARARAILECVGRVPQ